MTRLLDTRFEVRGSRRASDAIERFFFTDETMARGAELIFPYLRERTKQNFEGQRAGEGGQWPGYSGSERAYGVIKRKLIGEEYGRRLLRWSPGMERLFPSVTEAGHPEHVAEIRGRTFRFGTTVPYAYKHQHGVGRGPAWAFFPKIKQRKFLTIGPRETAQVRRFMAQVTGI